MDTATTTMNDEYLHELTTLIASSHSSVPLKLPLASTENGEVLTVRPMSAKEMANAPTGRTHALLINYKLLGVDKDQHAISQALFDRLICFQDEGKDRVQLGISKGELDSTAIAANFAMPSIKDFHRQLWNEGGIDVICGNYAAFEEAYGIPPGMSSWNARNNENGILRGPTPAHIEAALGRTRYEECLRMDANSMSRVAYTNREDGTENTFLLDHDKIWQRGERELLFRIAKRILYIGYGTSDVVRNRHVRKDGNFEVFQDRLLKEHALVCKRTVHTCMLYKYPANLKRHQAMEYDAVFSWLKGGKPVLFGGQMYYQIKVSIPYQMRLDYLCSRAKRIASALEAEKAGVANPQQQVLLKKTRKRNVDRMDAMEQAFRDYFDPSMDVSLEQLQLINAVVEERDEGVDNALTVENAPTWQEPQKLRGGSKEALDQVLQAAENVLDEAFGSYEPMMWTLGEKHSHSHRSKWLLRQAVISTMAKDNTSCFYIPSPSGGFAAVGFLTRCETGPSPAHDSSLFHTWSKSLTWVWQLGPHIANRSAALSEAVEAMHEKDTSEEGMHYLITLVGASPQGRGFGSQLLDAILEEVDSHGASSYLWTGNERNVAMYQKLGFTRQSEWKGGKFPDGSISPGLIMYGMLRPAQ